jgi:predicted  nucleic acid-binding Zn-ribbon protein
MTTATRDLLERLRKLQDIDLEIARADRELAAGPAAAQELAGEISGLDQKVKAVEDRTRVFKAQIRLRENELKALDAKVQRLKDQSSSVKTNKEFMAFRSEISGHQAEVDKLSGEVLKILDAVEKGEKEARDLRDQRAQVDQRRKDAQARVESRLGGAKSRREELLSQRPALLQSLTPEVREAYERARRARGNALSSVEGEYCGGCMERLTKNDVIAVQNGSRLVICKACNRILFHG